jgi:hypothetical protein
VSACWCYPRTHSSLRCIRHNRFLGRFFGSVLPTTRFTRCGVGNRTTGCKWRVLVSSCIDLPGSRAVRAPSARVPDVVGSISYMLHRCLMMHESVQCSNKPCTKPGCSDIMMQRLSVRVLLSFHRRYTCTKMFLSISAVDPPYICNTALGMCCCFSLCCELVRNLYRDPFSRTKTK